MTARPDLALWPCSVCGAPGARNLAANGYCGEHLAAVLRSFDPAVFTAHGVGLQAGVARPDFGLNYAELVCVACDASWVGPIGESCPYCAVARELIVEYQATLTLTPPDVDPEHQDYDARMRGWAGRLSRAVDAGLIEERAASAAWRKAVRHVAA